VIPCTYRRPAFFARLLARQEYLHDRAVVAGRGARDARDPAAEHEALALDWAVKTLGERYPDDLAEARRIVREHEDASRAHRGEVSSAFADAARRNR